MKGLLVVIPHRARGAEPVAPGVVLAGLPLLRRIVLGAERAGLQPVVVGYARSAVEPLLVGTSAVVVGPGAPPPAMPDGRIVLLPVSVIPQPEWLRGILEMPLEPERLYVDRAGAAVLETADVGAVIAAASRCGNLDEVVAALRPALGKVELPFDVGGRFVLAGPGQLPAAERWLLRGLIKPTEGFMSRHFERRVSLALTRRLCTTPITPNVMTLVSVAIGLGGAPFFLSASPGLQLTGALLFLLHSILDGCDGELARLKFLESRSGAMLDAIGDNLVHEAVFICMTIGWMLASDSQWPPLLFGGIAIASTLCVALVVHGRGMRASTDGGPNSAVSRVADVMVYRDFIYVIVMLAALGQAWWFLVITAIGGPMFLLLLAWLGRKR